MSIKLLKQFCFQFFLTGFFLHVAPLHADKMKLRCPWTQLLCSESFLQASIGFPSTQNCVPSTFFGNSLYCANFKCFCTNYKSKIFKTKMKFYPSPLLQLHFGGQIMKINKEEEKDLFLEKRKAIRKLLSKFTAISVHQASRKSLSLLAKPYPPELRQFTPSCNVFSTSTGFF